MLTPAALEDFRSSLRGSVLTPADPAYDDARRIFNAMIDHRPALIARCAGAADVVACVQFARAQGLPVSVRGGGHNASGDRKSTRLNSSHIQKSRMPSSA